MALLRDLGLVQDFDQAPPLQLGERAGLDDLHRVPRLRDVLLVVGVEGGSAADDLLVEGVTNGPLDRDGAGLLHLVGDDHAHLGVLAALFFGRSRLLDCCCHDVSLNSYALAARRFSEATVSVRARSRLLVRLVAELSSCPIECWKRSLKILSRCSFSRVVRASGASSLSFS